MTDREKVIKGLECCIIRHPDDKTRCDECPYESACCNRLKMDALTLLKAQEPRVMALEEVLALPGDTPIYIENCDGLYGWDIFSGTAKDYDNDVVTGASWATAEYWSQEEYGDTWRCWTSCPTDEQREATAWEN